MAYTRTYRDFAGIDVSSEPSEVHDRRFAYAMNVWKDYHNENGEAVETAPGFLVLDNQDEEVNGKVNGLHHTLEISGNSRLICHIGTDLYVVRVEVDVLKFDRIIAADVRDTQSRSVTHYGKLYLVDGGKYRVVQQSDTNGEFSAIEVSENPYVPTTFLNGDAYEQRNMLTPKFIEKYKTHKRTEEDKTEDGTEEKDTQTFVVHEPVTVDTPYLYATYKSILNEKDIIDHTVSLYLNVPSDYYDSNSTFYSSTDAIVPEEKIVWGNYTPVTSPVMRGYRIDQENQTHDWYYCIDKDGNYMDIDRADKVAESKGEKQGAKFNIEKIDDIEYVVSIEIGGTYNSGSAATKDYIADGDLIIYGEADPAKFASVGDMKDMLSGNPDFSKNTTALSAINGCTLIEEFDGRLFLSGNPNLPNSVFYTQRRADTGLNDPSYIGAYNYLNDGTGSTPITAMISTPTYLVVLKDDVAQGSSAYYHTGQYNPSDDKITANLQPRVYPCEQGVPNVGCVGCATNFLDDPCYLSLRGVEALGKSQVNLERAIAHRSYLVDAELINEDLRNARIAEWDGYLCILVPGGRMYLADSRQIDSTIHGHRQYEWYKWDGIGVHSTKTERYRYDNYPSGIVKDADGKVNADDGIEVVVDGSGGYTNSTPRYISAGDKTFLAVKEKRGDDPTEYWFPVSWHGEYRGTNFKQATSLLSLGGKLFFGCEDGTICAFTTDERDGNHRLLPQAYIRERKNEEGFYTGLGYLACMATKSDHCGRTNVAKSTEKGTFIIKVKAYATTKMTVKVRADGGEWTEYYNNSVALSKIDDERFDLDFASASFNTEDSFLIAIRERKRKWVEKQIFFEGWCFKTPFGLISATYDFSVAGKVKLR